ncbi:methyltransferase domain-containing protein [Spirosoma sp. HMF4905]|uniref:Methyltransferase domain-containing protein n=1 Tax=Spirosoma arboris TaxID=2682092 RepID=A0A7K1SAY3_9BACT|nr:class I SAM-dependent methyltransferase [Spirosoma arboris]MVM30915.1 methyltransferase domain-containing protein [Spirosoma arboris]
MTSHTTLRQFLEQMPTASGVWLLSTYVPDHTHEEVYLQVRTKENRVLSDELVRQLPDLPKGAPHYAEWQLRKQTAERFCTDLAQVKKPLQILDLGCGNGWFSAKLAKISQVRVVGLDLNLPELQQAHRLFSQENLLFCYGDILTVLFQPQSFDKVVLNAAIQYFHPIDQLIEALFRLLMPGGEIHILDSPFYEIDEVENARQRTADYYQQLGYPAMARFYFHHTFQRIAPYSPVYKNKNESFWKRLFTKNQNPFPWIIIKKGASY